MSLRLMERVWRECRARPYAKLLLLALADHAHDDGAGAYPAYRRLVSRTGISHREVKRLIAELETDGYLTVLRQPGRSSNYIVHPNASTQARVAQPELGPAVLIPGPAGPTTGVPWASPAGPAGPRTVGEPVVEPEGIHSLPTANNRTEPLPPDAVGTSNLYKLHGLLTGTRPDKDQERWMNDLTMQAGGGDEARSLIASVMRRWWTEGKPAGKNLLGWTSHQLRQEVRQ